LQGWQYSIITEKVPGPPIPRTQFPSSVLCATIQRWCRFYNGKPLAKVSSGSRADDRITGSWTDFLECATKNISHHYNLDCNEIFKFVFPEDNSQQSVPVEYAADTTALPLSADQRVEPNIPSTNEDCPGATLDAVSDSYNF